MAKDKIEQKNKKIDKIKDEKEERTEKVKQKKRKMTASEKRQIGMRITGWIMALIMIAGVVMTFLSFFAN